MNDSPKRWFLEVSNFLRNIGWKTSALDECVFFDPESKVFGRDTVFACGRSVVGWLWHGLSSKRSMHYVHVVRFANGTVIKENSVAVAFPRMFLPKRSLSQSTFSLKINSVNVRTRAQPEDKGNDSRSQESSRV